MLEITIDEWISLPREKKKTFTGCVNWPGDVKIYYYNGKCHRENGPAIEWPSTHEQYNEYYIHDVKTSKEGMDLYSTSQKLE